MKNTIEKLIKSIFVVILFLGASILVVFVMDKWKDKKYKEEYESTTWYEVEAVLDNVVSHKTSDSEGKRRTKYDLYFEYVGRDGNTYTYVDKGNYSKPYEGSTIKIYVDENDYSHSLEIRDIDDDGDFFFARLLGTFLLPYTEIILAFIVIIIGGGFIKSFFKSIKEKGSSGHR